MNFTMPVLSRPPRKVPFSTKLLLLFSNALSLWGWAFLSIGVMAAVMFLRNMDWSTGLFNGELTRASGKVTASVKTDYSVRANKNSSGTPIYAYDYTFEFDGKTYKGKAYQVGERTNNDPAVTVEFPTGKPDVSRVQGMSRAPIGKSGALALLIFPLVGLTMILPGILRGLKAIHILTNGEFAQGHFVNKETLNMKIAGQLMYKMTFEFTDVSGRLFQAIARTSKPEKLEEPPYVRIFYDAKDPNRSVLLDALPGYLRFDERGELQAVGFGQAFWVMLPPLIGTLCLIGALCLKFKTK